MNLHHVLLRRVAAKTVAIVSLLALIAAACGGGSDTEPTADGAQAPAAVATTAPIEAPASDEPPAVTDAGAGDTTDDADNPWEVSVLHVNDDVQIIPAFDGPNGNNITLYDQNAIDGIELEYPLLATTHFGNRLALLVEEYDSSGAWAKVQVPVRPNGTTAWVQTAFFTEEKHDYHITIDLSENTVRLFKGTDPEPIVEQISVLGKESRPTPVLRAYIDEKIPGGDLSPAYGDWILSIAAFSESLGTFGGGGMPKLAIHGTNQPELMGQYVSSGCIRVPNEVIAFIAETAPVGTVVEIVA